MILTNYFEFLIVISTCADEETQKVLLGKTTKERVEITRWISLSNSDLASEICAAVWPLIGYAPFNKKVVDAASEKVELYAQFFDSKLKEFTFLTAERVTLGDIFGFASWAFAFTTLCGDDFRAKHPYLVRWFNTVKDSKFLKEEFGEFKPIAKRLEPPKKVKAEKPKKADAPKAAKAEKSADPVDAPPAEQKKPKHPLEALGKPTFVLDEWKRKYSNEETREVALPWFWEHYNPEEYSIWKVEYKYNDELTLTFMSNNLIGGFFNRLSASVKYTFGALVVYGENNNNGIIGAIMLRGQDSVPAFDVAPDWESYSYTKLDPTNSADKEFINDMWAWDKPVVANGESKEIVDGKVLK